MKQHDIQAIIFDWGGVFDAKHESLHGFADVAAELGVEPQVLYDRLYSGESWQRARVGSLTDDEYMHTVMRDLDPTATDVAEFRNRLFAGRTVDREVIALARKLAADYPLALLSNATDQLEIVLHQHEVMGLFKVVINSARVGLAKPDPRIYWLALERLGVEAGEALFIDDKPRNVLAAEDLGIRSILFTDVVSLQRDLMALGVLMDEG